MEYKSEKIKIEETNDYSVAIALAYLAGFRQGMVIRLKVPGNYQGTERTIMVFHKDTVAEDPDLFLATQNPDILVSRFLGDEYLVESNHRVDKSLVGRIEEEIRIAYSEK